MRDDPFLDQDDRNGFGPEIINVEVRGEPFYDVYVHYYQNAFAQPTNATVRISSHGVPEPDQVRTLALCGDMWFVGRLDLEGDGLVNYVEALKQDWQGQVCFSKSPVVWSADHGEGDITWLMARAIAGGLWAQFQTDPDLTGRVRLKGPDGAAAKLVAALCEKAPALVVTTSHGVTGPSSLGAALVNSLGLPIDVDHKPLSLADLSAWRPSGAIWYSHACCSAGADRPSRYDSLLPADGDIAKTLSQVANFAGPMISPLPRTLLGAAAPLRAFVGHVEPTFDWTLRDPDTKQPLTHILIHALYNKLFKTDRRTPIGFALRSVFEEAGAFYGAWQDAVRGIDNNEPNMRDWALYRQLVAMDRQTTVVLGDPTVSLPSLA